MVLIARLSLSFDPKTDEQKKPSDIVISGSWRVGRGARQPVSTLGIFDLHQHFHLARSQPTIFRRNRRTEATASHVAGIM
jgi:hypothetical protein